MDKGTRIQADLFRILVVDDAADAREVIQTHLEDEGYAVRVCSSVEEALQLIASSVFDVIITDLRMPRGSGLELIQHVRNNLEDVEIMMITGYPSIEGAVEAIKTGAEHYLAKPFTERELLVAVRSIVAKLVRKRLAHGGSPSGQSYGIVGASAAMQYVFKLIGKASDNTATVNIS
jgi:two-component system, NtrC family, response regulator HydG